MVFIHWQTVSYEGAGVLQPSFNITLEHFYSTQCEIVLMLLYLSVRNFLAVFSDPQLNTN